MAPSVPLYAELEGQTATALEINGSGTGFMPLRADSRRLQRVAESEVGQGSEQGSKSAPATVSTAKNGQPNESSDDYSTVVAMSGDRRVIESRCGLQWIVQRRMGNRWRSKYFCRTKEGLLRFAGFKAPELDALPDRFPERGSDSPRTVPEIENERTSEPVSD